MCTAQGRRETFARTGKKRTPILTTMGEGSNYGRQGSVPLPEPKVTLKVEGKPIQFMVDTGAENSMLVILGVPLSKRQTPVQGRTADLGMGWVIHSFLVIPE